MEFHSFVETITFLSFWHIDFMCHIPKLYSEFSNEKLKNELALQLNWQLFDTSSTVMYTYEFVSYHRLSVTPTIQCFPSIFVLNSFNLLHSIDVVSMNKSFYI